jgi:DNA phosphorothioation-dependent restriction protein DptG
MYGDNINSHRIKFSLLGEQFPGIFPPLVWVQEMQKSTKKEGKNKQKWKGYKKKHKGS